MKATPYAPLFVSLVLFAGLAVAQDAAPLPQASAAGQGGWRTLGEQDFVNVNCDADTWSFDGGLIRCTGKPTGVMRMKEPIKNFELTVEWKHLKSAGNSGVFVWASAESINALHEGKHNKRLPDGIEVQILDHGYRENYVKKTGKSAGLFFTTNGDVFPTGTAKLKPFEPTSPNGSRSFPRKELSKGFGQWNHYAISAIDGTVRLSVNGEEVSGGSGAEPASGYLCLESEGSPIEFRNLKIRLLP